MNQSINTPESEKPDSDQPAEEARCRCLFRWSDHLMFTRPVEVVPGCPDHKPEDAQQ